MAPVKFWLGTKKIYNRGEIMEISYKFRLYPNKRQEDLILRTFGCCRFVFNYYLFQRIESYKKTGKSPTRFMQDKDLTTLKRQEDTIWLKEVDKCALQNTLKRLDSAYQHFFRRVKEGKAPGFPHFKSKKQKKQSYQTNGTIKVLEDTIQLPKLGGVKCRVSRAIKGRILSATVSRTASGKYYVTICCRLEDGLQKLPSTGAVVGLDLGIKSFCVSSDGMEYANHRSLQQSEKKLARLQRKLSRKTKDSKNWNKNRIQIARLHEHIANQRRDMQQKLSTEIVRQNDIICIENLTIKNMVRNHKLAKSISDAGWGEFCRQLTYKAAWYGKQLVVIDRFYPSSQTCSVCGAQWSGTKDLKVRHWICPVCGVSLDRDVNAAINIMHEGMRLLAQ